MQGLSQSEAEMQDCVVALQHVGGEQRTQGPSHLGAHRDRSYVEHANPLNIADINID